MQLDISSESDMWSAWAARAMEIFSPAPLTDAPADAAEAPTTSNTHGDAQVTFYGCSLNFLRYLRSMLRVCRHSDSLDALFHEARAEIRHAKSASL
eukprot:10681151-Alexandrium_andersonii.AAC.1